MSDVHNDELDNSDSGDYDCDYDDFFIMLLQYFLFHLLYIVKNYINYEVKNKK